MTLSEYLKRENKAIAFDITKIPEKANIEDLVLLIENTIIIDLKEYESPDLHN